MEIKQLDIGFDKIEKIVHIGDIHCRLIQRHVEYREVFNELYEEIKLTPPNTLIINTGDTHHNKNDLSSEGVNLIADFLKNLADLRPTILILGNHDLNLSNGDRLDAMTPVVRALNHDKLFFLRDSGIYRAGDCLFNVMSVLDEPSDFIPNNKISTRVRNNVSCLIDLYHGPIHGVKTNLGYTIKNPHMMLDKFDGADIAMLGDIHIHRVLQERDETNKKPIVVYCSSLIAQDHSETDPMHGFCYWDIKTKSFDYKRLKNDYAFFTATIKDGKLITDMSNCPPKPKLRLKCFNSSVTEVKQVVTEIRKSFELTDLVYIREEDETALTESLDSDNKLTDLNIASVDTQNQLIIDYLKKIQDDISDEQIEAIKKINKSVNSTLPVEDSIRNLKWKLKRLEFDNCFAYGEGNVIDFTQLQDVIGLFSKNASGKSSLISVLCFALFDKTERTFKANEIMNSQKMSFICKVNFEVNGVDYWIQRKGSRDKKGSVKVDVKFWKIEKGEEVSLNDEARRGTNSVIRDYIGSFEDFSLTSLALQGKDTAFLDLGQTEKKDLLTRFIGINIFDRLFTEATEKYKETSVLLKSYQKEDFTVKLATIESDIKDQTQLTDTFKSEYEDNVNKKELLTTNLLTETQKLITLNDVPTDITTLNENKTKFEKNIDNLKNYLVESVTQFNNLVTESRSIKNRISELENMNVITLKKELDTLEEEKCSVEHELELKKVWYTDKASKVKHLDNHKYDPNCKFCMDNIFVKDALDAKELIEKEKPIIQSLNNKIKEYTKKISDLSYVSELFSELETKNEEFKNKKEFANKIKTQQGEYNNKIDSNENLLKSTISNIELYEKSKTSIEHNKVIESNIVKIKAQIRNIDVDVKTSNKKWMDFNSKITSLKDQKAVIEKNITHAKELEKEFKSYELYLKAINRDGIPYELISQSLPKIQNEVNNILSQIVEFTMELKTDGKNVLTNIVYEDKKWRLELCSGMEKFCSALALRVALMNVSSIPRSNFLSIDEGFAACDSDHMSMVQSLLSYLKTNFDFILIISHLDVMKDMVNSHLEIHKNQGFSKITNI